MTDLASVLVLTAEINLFSIINITNLSAFLLDLTFLVLHIIENNLNLDETMSKHV